MTGGVEKSHEKRHSDTVTHAEGVGKMIRGAGGPVPLSG